MNNDLISREALLREYFKKCDRECCTCIQRDDESGDCGLIRYAPAVDAEPVRHGRWLKLAYDPAWTKCSECGCNWEWGMVENCNMKYCPNCGARMDGENNG